MTLVDVGFFEVGASGRVYQREEILATVFKRYQDPDYLQHDHWHVDEFRVQQLEHKLYLVTYLLTQGDEKRVTRRATLWRQVGGSWCIRYHQGTVIVSS